MRRNSICVVLLVFLFSGWLWARENTILKVRVQTAHVRSEPDAASEVIARLSSGTLLESAGRDGAWYEVTVNDQSGKAVTGYIHNSVVDVIAGETEEEQERPRSAAHRETPRFRSAKSFAGGGFKLLGGLSMGNLNLSEDISADKKKTSKIDFMGGLGFESAGRIAIELDLLYSPGGAIIKAIDSASKAKLTISGTAITIPVMLKLRLLRGTTPFVLAGGEVGYTLSQKLVTTGIDGAQTGEEDISEDVNRLLYGVVLGGGVELQAGGLNLVLEARYRLGLSNLIKDADPGAYAKPTALSFLLGVKF
jgi:hypothetical protein